MLHTQNTDSGSCPKQEWVRNNTDFCVRLVAMVVCSYPWQTSTLWVKKNCANLTMAINLSVLNRFANLFTAAKSDKFPTKSILVYPPQLKCVAALPWEIKTICTDTFLETLSTLQLTSRESISRHVSMQMVDILNIFCEQTHANHFHFHINLCTYFHDIWQISVG